jgi:hypothetical protein
VATVTVVNDSSSLVTILLNGDTGDVTAGGNGQGGGLSLYPKGANGSIPDTATIALGGAEGHARIGGGYYQTTGTYTGPPVLGVDGKLTLQDQYGTNTAVVDGQDGSMLLGAGADDSAPIRLDPGKGLVRVGGGSAPPPAIGVSITPQGTDGVVSLQDKNKKEVIRLGAASANIVAGGNAHGGDLALFAAQATDTSTSDLATVHLNGQTANIRAGGNGQDGDLLLFASQATSKDIASSTNPTIHLDGQTGNISITGDVLLTGADCAEDFGIAEAHAVEPGTVMVIGEEGRLHASSQAYDKRVAGVVAGAGAYRSGIVLDRRASQVNRKPVALVGKVYCKVDAGYSPIEIGDLLTTSPTAGCAMKADDPLRSFGAVIGKALQPLKEGRSLIPILVALQ